MNLSFYIDFLEQLPEFESMASLVGLVFLCIAAYTLCRNRGYSYAWMGAVPVLNGYALGGVADHIQSCYGKRTHYRVWLLVGNILDFISLFIYAGWLLNFIWAFLTGNTSAALFYLPLGTILAFAVMGGAITCRVFRYIALYHIYRDYSPRYVALFLILSILFGGLGIEGYFLFALRNKPSASLAYLNACYSSYTPGAGGNPPPYR